MFLASSELHLRVFKHQSRTIFLIAFVGKTISMTCLLESGLSNIFHLKTIYFIEIVIDLTVKKSFAFNCWRKWCIIWKSLLWVGTTPSSSIDRNISFDGIAIVLQHSLIILIDILSYPGTLLALRFYVIEIMSFSFISKYINRSSFIKTW